MLNYATFILHQTMYTSSGIQLGLSIIKTHSLYARVITKLVYCITYPISKYINQLKKGSYIF